MSDPDSHARQPTPQERALLARLLELEFPGVEQLRQQVTMIEVRTIDDDGWIEFTTRAGSRATVRQRVPVEAEGFDEDGGAVHLLLHVVDGYAEELEVYREDGERVRQIPKPEDLIPFAPTE